MEEIDSNSSSKQSFYYIFHSPLDKVYNIFRTPNLFTSTFFQNIKIISMKRETTLDDTGNEFNIIWNNSLQYNFKVDNTVNLPYFKSFTHKSLNNPPSTSDFINTFSFFWNSTDKVTIFKFIGTQDDSEHKNIIAEYIMENKDSMCLSTENYLMKTVNNLEENESISIDKSIDEVWKFVSDINNQVYFYPNNKIKINIIDNEKFEIVDIENNTVMTFKVSKMEMNEDKKQFQCELINSTVSLPKQKVLICLVRMDENQCFVIFKHIILEYIPFDILMSYSSTKKKVLRNIKSLLEKKPFKQEQGEKIFEQ